MSRIVLRASFVVLIAAVFAGDRPAQAVWFNPRGVGIGYGVGMGLGGAYGYGMGYGMGGMGYGGYGGTAGGNYLQGMSQVIRAQGQYNEQTTKAYINYEEARTKYIDNRKKWTETYLSMRQQNQAAQTEKLEKSRHSPEAIAAAGRSRTPRSLGSEALDPITGKITWPDLLQGSEYAKSREEVEHLFELRSTTGGGDAGMSIQNGIQQMVATLKSNIQNVPANDYIAARKFLDSLAVAARS